MGATTVWGRDAVSRHSDPIGLTPSDSHRVESI